MIFGKKPEVGKEGPNEKVVCFTQLMPKQEERFGRDITCAHGWLWPRLLFAAEQSLSLSKGECDTWEVPLLTAVR